MLNKTEEMCLPNSNKSHCQFENCSHLDGELVLLNELQCLNGLCHQGKLPWREFRYGFGRLLPLLINTP